MTISRQYQDIYCFIPEENRRFARSNFTKLVHTNARFEGVNTTLPQTQTIMDGMSVAGVSVADILTIINLKKGWQYVTTQTAEMMLPIEKEINKIVAAEDALVPGELRRGTGGVHLGSDEYFEPPMVDEKTEQTYLQDLLNSERTTTDKALTLMYHNMRQQIFWDGNKRTATLVANKIMIVGGAGLINVPLDKWKQWNELIADFYCTNDMQAVKEWTYQNGIQGLEVRYNK